MHSIFELPYPRGPVKWGGTGGIQMWEPLFTAFLNSLEGIQPIAFPNAVGGLLSRADKCA
jgi:hypothetical protein